jgi:hypothetical protein
MNLIEITTRRRTAVQVVKHNHILSLPKTRYLLKQLLLRPTMSSLLSDVRLQLPPGDPSRLRPLSGRFEA